MLAYNGVSSITGRVTGDIPLRVGGSWVPAPLPPVPRALPGARLHPTGTSSAPTRCFSLPFQMR